MKYRLLLCCFGEIYGKIGVALGSIQKDPFQNPCGPAQSALGEILNFQLNGAGKLRQAIVEGIKVLSIVRWQRKKLPQCMMEFCKGMQLSAIQYAFKGFHRAVQSFHSGLRYSK